MEDRKYGTDPEMDKLVDSTNAHDREHAASRGYALDILKKDANKLVREYVAYACSPANYNRLDILTDLSKDNNINVLSCVAEAIDKKDIAATKTDFKQSEAIIDILQSVTVYAICAYNNSNKDYIANKMINTTLSEVLKRTTSIDSMPDLDPYFEDIHWFIFDRICDNPDLKKSCTDRDTYSPPDAPPLSCYKPMLVTLANVTKSKEILIEIAKMTENIPKGYRSNDNEYTVAAKCRLKELNKRLSKTKAENER